MPNELNNKYNTLKVIQKLPSQNGRAYWKCQCEICGSEYSFSGTQLRTKNPVCPQCEKIGEYYGDLEVIDFAYISEDRHKYWKCKCKCGNIEVIRASDLNNQKRVRCLSCNKNYRKTQFINETGNHYGDLEVLEYDIEKSGKNAWWKCRCKCGNLISIEGTKLRSNHTRSCGCMKSRGERKIIELLQQYNINYKTQVSFPDCADKDLLKFDFAIYDDENNLSHLIEYDGIQHFYPTFGETHFQGSQRRDQIKNQYCITHNIPLIRISYEQYDNLNIHNLLLERN